MKKERSPDQTATAFSMSKKLYEAMEKARTALNLDRSNFIRLCISKELASMGIIRSDGAFDFDRIDILHNSNIKKTLKKHNCAGA
jgi:glutaredoxin-related protein